MGRATRRRGTGVEPSLASSTSQINATTPEQAATAFECDVTKKESVEAVFAAIEAAHHRLDVLVNNAGSWAR